MDSIVNCAGKDCDICSFLEIFSRLYNFLLLISFSLTVIFVVISGFLYLTGAGNKINFLRAISAFKKSLLGFSVILLSWLVISFLFKALGYNNSKNWWQFQCYENTKEKRSETTIGENNLEDKDEYKKKKYSSLSKFLVSGEPVGIVNGPINLSVFEEELKRLKNGQELSFYSPVKINNQNSDTKNLLVLTVAKEDNKIKIEKIGEFWGLVEEEWPEAKGFLSNQLGNTGFMVQDTASNDEKTSRKLIDEKGQPITQSKKINHFNSLFTSLNKIIFKRAASQSQLENGPEDLDALMLALINSMLSGEDSSEITSQMIAIIITELMKMQGSTEVGLEEYTEPKVVKKTTQNKNTNKAEKKEAVDPWDKKDDDEDGITNAQDACPNSEFDDPAVNRDKNDKLYGCSCSDLGILFKYCPQNQCEGDYLVVYPDETQECKNGRLNSYSCVPSGKIYDKICHKKTNSGEEKTGSLYNEEYFESTFGEYHKGDGTEKTIKQALKTIHQYDPLRYEMIFRFIGRIVDLGKDFYLEKEGVNGLATGCGTIYVDFNLPREALTFTILHETTHSAETCLFGDGSVDAIYNLDPIRGERIAIANEMGSIYSDMKELASQSRSIKYKGKEVRGYLSRLLTKVNPIDGRASSEIFYESLVYAETFGKLDQGPYKYGDPYIEEPLGLAEKEEAVLKSIVKNKSECQSRPPDDLPSIPACENAKHVLTIGGTTWH